MKVRVIKVNDKFLFCARDISSLLGYKRPNKPIHDFNIKSKKYKIFVRKRPQYMNFITMDEATKLIAKSKLANSDTKFEVWDIIRFVDNEDERIEFTEYQELNEYDYIKMEQIGMKETTEGTDDIEDFFCPGGKGDHLKKRIYDAVRDTLNEREKDLIKISDEYGFKYNYLSYKINKICLTIPRQLERVINNKINEIMKEIYWKNEKNNN